MDVLDCLLLWHVGFKGNVDSGKGTKEEEFYYRKVRSLSERESRSISEDAQ